MCKKNKFGAKKTLYNGVIYDSIAESEYAKILDKLLVEKRIRYVNRQVRYPLENYKDQMRLAYIADFVVISNTDKEYVIDVKGFLTRASSIKLAYFRYVYKKDIHIVHTKGKNAFDTSFII